jgi:hypothetical protein
VAMTAKADTRTKNLVGNIRTLPADRSHGGKRGMATKRLSTAPTYRPSALAGEILSQCQGFVNRELFRCE